jgi:CheY-like chemotaxis protein
MDQSGMTWLIVEDDAAIRDILVTMCDLWEIRTVTFKDGYGAESYLAADRPNDPLPDAALLDIRIPGPWGHEIGNRIREHTHLGNIPIVLMTAYELAGDDEQAYCNYAGADRLIYKPLPPMDELVELIQQMITERQTQAA